MQLTLAAALAVVAALAEFTVIPYLQIGDAVLQPVLVLAAIWTVIGGFEAGITAAFVGGLALDILSQRPLGASAFSLLIAVAAAALTGTALRRARVIAPVVATAAATLVYSMLLLLVTSMLSGAPTDGASRIVLPSAIYNTLVAALVGPLIAAVVIRRREAERADW